MVHVHRYPTHKVQPAHGNTNHIRLPPSPLYAEYFQSQYPPSVYPSPPHHYPHSPQRYSHSHPAQALVYSRRSRDGKHYYLGHGNAPVPVPVPVPMYNNSQSRSRRHSTGEGTREGPRIASCYFSKYPSSDLVSVPKMGILKNRGGYARAPTLAHQPLAHQQVPSRPARRLSAHAKQVQFVF